MSTPQLANFLSLLRDDHAGLGHIESVSKHKETLNMSKRNWLISIVAGTVLCALTVGCISMGWFLLNTFFKTNLPSYSMEQTASVHEGYRHTTLTNGNTVYVNDYEEYALLSINTQPPQMIGHLPVTEPGGTSGIYAIPGQDPSAYVLEYDPMYQAVYRNAQHPPFDWRAATFQKMRLGIPTGPAANKETTDPQVIEDVIRTLHGAEIFIVPLQPNGEYANYGNYALLLFSDQLPGLAYAAGVHIAPDGQAYLAENGISNQWHPASSFFLEWMSNE